jgi:hypothetical protein
MHHKLCATGVVSLIMVMNLRRFMRTDDAHERSPLPLFRAGGARWAVASDAAFEQLRGSAALAAFLKQLTPGPPFFRDTEAARIETQGHELSVFRQYLIDTSFFPTYQLADSTLAIVNPTLLADPTLTAHLQAWTFKLRLTRNGMAVVKLERNVTEEPFATISEMILETQRFLPASDLPDGVRVPTQWQLAMDVVAQFVRACGCRFVIPGGAEQDHGDLIINLQPEYAAGTLPLHDRHIVYLFSTISAGGRPVDATALRGAFAHEVVGLLENSLVLQQSGAQYPAYKPEIIADVFAGDTATWQDEICLLTPEATFIWHPTIADVEHVVGGGKRPERNGLYQDYWLSIARGIEHIIALKNELQLIERKTTKLLEKVPDITRRVTDGTLNKADHQAISDLATGIATLFRSLPQQRDLLVPSSVFRWSAAHRKFHRLMELLGIYAIERHIQTNVEELNAFLAHFNSVQSQYAAQRTSLRFAVVTMLFSLMIIPSCMADAMQVWEERAQFGHLPLALNRFAGQLASAHLTQPLALGASTVLGVLFLIGVVIAAVRLAYRRRTAIRRALPGMPEAAKRKEPAGD